MFLSPHTIIGTLLFLLSSLCLQLVGNGMHHFQSCLRVLGISGSTLTFTREPRSAAELQAVVVFVVV